MDASKPCLSLSWGYIEPDRESPFLAENAWTCGRCGQTFSEQNPTYMQGLKEACDSFREARGGFEFK